MTTSKLKDLQIGDMITIYIPGEAEKEEVEIMHIPQHPTQQWMLKRTNGTLVGIHTRSPITKCQT